MKPSERRALIFTLMTTKRHVEQKITTLKRRIKSDNNELESLLRQMSDIEQSLAYLDNEN